MIHKTSVIIEKSQDDLEKDLVTAANIPDSKVFTKSEEVEIKSQFAAFQYTVEKCSMGHLCPPEFKGIVSEFEHAGYDIEKLSPATKNSLKQTYNDLKYACENDSRIQKNSAANVYCTIFEFLSGTTAKTLFNRLKNSKAAKKFAISKEDLSVEGLQNALMEYNHNMNDIYAASMEGKIAEFLKSGTSFINTGTATFKTMPSTFAGIKDLLVIVVFILLVLLVLIIALTVINMAYTTELSKLLSELTSVEIKQLGGSENTRKSKVIEAANNMNTKTPIGVNKLLFKPAALSVKFLDKNIKKNSKVFNDIIDETDKSVEAFENFDMSKEDGTSEALKTIMDFIKTKSKWIIIPAVVFAIVKVIFPMIRGSLYFVKHFGLKASTFFKEQAEWVDLNVESLIEKRDDVNTTEEERKRLDKIIAKQQAWGRRLSSWANHFYKSQIEAANDARDEIREEEKIDFDKFGEDSEPTVTPEVPVASTPAPTKQSPVFVF